MENLPMFPPMQQLSAAVFALISRLLSSRNTIRASTEALLSLGWQSWAPALSLTRNTLMSLSTNHAMDIIPDMVTRGTTICWRQHVLCQWADSFNLTVPLPRHDFLVWNRFTHRGAGTGSAWHFFSRVVSLVASGVRAMCWLLTMLKRPSDV